MKELELFERRFSPKVQEIKRCQAKPMPQDYICFLMFVFYLSVLMVVRCLSITQYSDDQLKGKIYHLYSEMKFQYAIKTQFLNSLFFIYFDNYFYFISKIRYIKSTFFGVNDFIVLCVRSFVCVYPLYSVVFDNQRKQMEKIKNRIRKLTMAPAPKAKIKITSPKNELLKTRYLEKIIKKETLCNKVKRQKGARRVLSNVKKEKQLELLIYLKNTLLCTVTSLRILKSGIAMMLVVYFHFLCSGFIFIYLRPIEQHFWKILQEILYLVYLLTYLVYRANSEIPQIGSIFIFLYVVSFGFCLFVFLLEIFQDFQKNQQSKKRKNRKKYPVYY